MWSVLVYIVENMLELQPKTQSKNESAPESASGLVTTTTTYVVQEVWSGGKPTGDKVKCSDKSSCDPLTVHVDCCGGTTYVRLVPQ